VSRGEAHDECELDVLISASLCRHQAYRRRAVPGSGGCRERSGLEASSRPFRRAPCRLCLLNRQVPLADIRDNFKLAQSFVEASARAGSGGTSAPSTRCLEIISEASRRLPASVKSRHPGHSVEGHCGAGNVYRHDYENVATDLIWNTIKVLSKPLDVVEGELPALEAEPP
jgi:uncharacterized protein with HEPN domain